MSELFNQLYNEAIINTSGIYPVRYTALVKPDKIEAKVGSIYLPDTTKERQQVAQTKGTFIAADIMAFEEMKAVGARIPQPGDRVYYTKYAGALLDGVDGEQYQMVKDEDILAIIDKE